MHDGGLTQDLARIMTRRRALGLAVTAGAGLALSGCDLFGYSESNRVATAADGSQCIKTPEEWRGPYPADGSNARNGATLNVLRQAGLVRADIRQSFDGMTPVAEGVPLGLEIRLVDMDRGCAPLAGHLVYLWHCDVAGKYSLYDYDDRNYLRGAGLSDAEGLVNFTSIFPGCYPGRWPHMHVEVFKPGGGELGRDDSLVVSQFAMPEEATRAVYAGNPAYAPSLSTLALASMAKDDAFGDNTPEQNAALTFKVAGDAASGYRATLTMGIVPV